MYGKMKPPLLTYASSASLCRLRRHLTLIRQSASAALESETAAWTRSTMYAVDAMSGESGDTSNPARLETRARISVRTRKSTETSPVVSPRPSTTRARRECPSVTPVQPQRRHHRRAIVRQRAPAQPPVIHRPRPTVSAEIQRVTRVPSRAELGDERLEDVPVNPFACARSTAFELSRARPRRARGKVSHACIVTPSAETTRDDICGRPRVGAPGGRERGRETEPFSRTSR